MNLRHNSPFPTDPSISGIPPIWRRVVRSAIVDLLPVPPFDAKLATTARSTITWLSTLDGNRGAYEAFVSTGDLHVMDDVDLARKIQNYYARADEVYDQDRADQNVRDYVAESLHRVGIGFLDDATMDALVNRVREDLQLAAALSTLQVHDNFQRQHMGELSDEATALISLIEEKK